jgi:cellulase/cellobiase CelA1
VSRGDRAPLAEDTGTSTINGWTLAFAYAGTQTLTQGWSTNSSQSGRNVTATNLSRNGSLAPGASTSIGFNANYTGVNAAPTGFTLNGSTCS